MWMRVKNVTLKVVLLGAVCVVGAMGVGLLRAQAGGEGEAATSPELTVAQRVDVEVSRLEAGGLGDRIMAAGELAKIGPAAIEAVPSLVTQLEDENFEARGMAAVALGEIGVQDEDVEARLLRLLLFDDYAGVRIAGMQAVQKIHARRSVLAAAAAE